MSRTLADLVAVSPVPLPPGRLVTPQDGGAPAYWLSDAPVGPELVAALRAAGPGLYPMLLTGLSGPDDPRPWVDGEVFPTAARPTDHDAGDLLRDWWRSHLEHEADEHPWPGPAVAGDPQDFPDGHADDFAEFQLADTPLRLGLVAAGSGAEALTVCGWSGPANYAETGEIASVVADWETRFGARVVTVGFDTLELSVSAPPVTIEHARVVAAEQFAFCPDTVWQGTGKLEELAEQILGSVNWSFWWD
ncbi:DUF4253 domain-containing protein [Micromonosporaceae bacterium Da 78-11]